MHLKLWGVRGSIPSPISPERLRHQIEEILIQFEKLREAGLTARQYLETLPPHVFGGFGGNTICGEVREGETRLLIDAGSGLRAFSDVVMRTEPETSEFHFYFTHFHWDHLVGLPFFTPLYVKGREIHIYSVEDAEKMARTLFQKPYFPVPYEVVQPQLRFHRLTPRESIRIGELNLTPYRLDHPDACWGARIEAQGKSLAWSVDNECVRMSSDDLGEDVHLYRKADLLVFDAQYSFREALEKINWGHASGPIGLDLALREEIRRVVFIHHDPAALDVEIREAEQQTIAYSEELSKMMKRAGRIMPKILWSFGREGEEFEVGEANGL